jgi:hypothetical protein
LTNSGLNDNGGGSGSESSSSGGVDGIGGSGSRSIVGVGCIGIGVDLFEIVFIGGVGDGGNGGRVMMFSRGGVWVVAWMPLLLLLLLIKGEEREDDDDDDDDPIRVLNRGVRIRGEGSRAVEGLL